MNLANRLTLARLALTVAFVIVLSCHYAFAATVALVLFVVASITDWLDGWVARRYAMSTAFGKLMDPLVDKIMTASAFICLVTLGALPAWVAILMISREFLITGLRLLAAAQGRVLPSESLGKHKTAWQMITICYFLLLLTLDEWFSARDLDPQWMKVAWSTGGTLLVAISALLTVWSGGSYLWKNRAVISDR